MTSNLQHSSSTNILWIYIVFPTGNYIYTSFFFLNLIGFKFISQFLFILYRKFVYSSSLRLYIFYWYYIHVSGVKYFVSFSFNCCCWILSKIIYINRASILTRRSPFKQFVIFLLWHAFKKNEMCIRSKSKIQLFIKKFILCL